MASVIDHALEVRRGQKRLKDVPEDVREKVYSALRNTSDTAFAVLAESRESRGSLRASRTTFGRLRRGIST